MIKLIVLVKRKQGMSSEEFHRYWNETHGSVVLGVPEFKRHLRRYVQSHTMEGANLDFPSGPSQFDGAAELYFDDVESMNRAFNEPRYLEVVRPDEQKFLDLDACQLMVTQEIPKYTPGQ